MRKWPGAKQVHASLPASSAGPEVGEFSFILGDLVNLWRSNLFLQWLSILSKRQVPLSWKQFRTSYLFMRNQLVLFSKAGQRSGRSGMRQQELPLTLKRTTVKHHTLLLSHFLSLSLSLSLSLTHTHTRTHSHTVFSVSPPWSFRQVNKPHPKSFSRSFRRSQGSQTMPLLFLPMGRQCQSIWFNFVVFLSKEDENLDSWCCAELRWYK